MLYGHINEAGLLEVQELKERSEKIAKEVKDKITGQISIEAVTRIITIEEQEDALSKEGWKPADEMDISGITCQGFEEVQATPDDAGDRITYNYEVIISKIKINQKIKDLKKRLTDSDYMIIKSYESSLLNQSTPYNIESLHSERQALRDEINILEGLLQ